MADFLGVWGCGQDAWDASDSEKKVVKPTGPPPPIRQKGITKMKIAEKEAAEKARLAEIASRVSTTLPLSTTAHSTQPASRLANPPPHTRPINRTTTTRSPARLARRPPSSSRTWTTPPPCLDHPVSRVSLFKRGGLPNQPPSCSPRSVFTAHPLGLTQRTRSRSGARPRTTLTCCLP